MTSSIVRKSKINVRRRMKSIYDNQKKHGPLRLQVPTSYMSSLINYTIYIYIYIYSKQIKSDTYFFKGMENDN